MAQSNRGATIFRKRGEDEGFFSDLREMPAGTPPRDPQQSQSTLSVQSSGRAPQSGRAERMFNTEAGPAEQAYSSELAKPEPTYNRPAKATGAKKVFGNILSQFRGTQNIGDRMVYGDVPEAREDFGLAVDARQRQLGHMGAAATLEGKGRDARNTAMWRTTDLNYKGARNSREESLLPRRMKLLESQIGKENASAGAQKALAEQRRRPSAARSPFSTYSPGQGTYNRDTGQVQTPADPSAARQARPQTRAGAGGPSANQLALSERNKTKLLLGHKRERDKLQAQIESKNEGMSPTLPDGSANPMYTRDNDLAELGKWDEQQKNMIQRGYEQELGRLGQNVEEPEVAAEGEGVDLNAAMDEPEDDGDMSADSGDMEDGEEAAAPTEDTDIPIGTTYRNSKTGERIKWNGQAWEPVR